MNVKQLTKENVMKKMFSKNRSRIAPDIGIDLGSMNTRLFVKGKGVVLEVPTVVAIRPDSKHVLAVGAKGFVHNSDESVGSTATADAVEQILHSSRID